MAAQASARGEKIQTMWRLALVGVVAAIGGAALAPARQVPWCTDTSLQLSRAGPMSPETGEIVSAFTLRNRAGTSCEVGGYPGVRLLAVRGPLPFHYRWGGHYFGTRGRPHRILLAPGRLAWFVVGKYRCDAGSLAVARDLAVVPPDGTRALHLRLSRRAPIFDYCRAFRGPNAKDPGNTVEIGPLHASAAPSGR